MLPFCGMWLRQQLRRSATFALVVLAMVLGGCKRVEEPVSDPRPASSGSASAASTPAAVSALAPTPPLLTPSALLTLPSSAYQAALFADDQAIELLTQSAAYRLEPGKEPVSRAIDLGYAATVSRSSYVYWSQGALCSEPRRAPGPGGRVQLAALADQPQRIVADMAADEFAFLERSEANRYLLQRLERGRVKTLYASAGSIDALTMIADALYFVERPANAEWRIGRVKLSGGNATFTNSYSGRWPALLRGEKDLVYYDGARRNVLSVSLDLKQERTLAKDFICSPLAVGASASVYCSTMEGVFELSATGKRRQIVAAPRQLITNLAVDPTRLAFISDAGGHGQDHLTVYVVPLSAPSATDTPR